MTKIFLIFLVLLFKLSESFALTQASCCSSSPWYQSAYARLNQIWAQGDNEIYLPSYAWHNRFVYDPRKIHSYNEMPWGGGLGKGFYDELGDWHGLYAFAFLDSHKNIEPVVGYAFLKILPINENTRIGAGYGVLVTARPDIFHNIPFAGVLPWISLNHRRLSLAATYIPGAKGAGNVLFLISKILLN